jgi:hypothetical protein
MMPDEPGIEPELKAFLRPIGTRRRAPDDVRKRAMAHARAIASAGGEPWRSTTSALSTVAPVAPVARRRHRALRLALACAVFVFGGIAAFAALRSRAIHDLQPGLAAQPTPAVPLKQPAPSQEPVMQPDPRANADRAPAAGAGRYVLTAEIELLRRARGAYGRREFSRALMLVAEHARRFPQGHLAEEREALRVRSLLGAGRTAEGHRAAESFALRFPRSVLLPGVTKD